MIKAHQKVAWVSLPFVLFGCCQDTLSYNPSNETYYIPDPEARFCVGIPEGNGRMLVHFYPNHEWSYGLEVRTQGPASANTKAFAITSSDANHSEDKFILYGDGRGHATAPFTFEAPIQVREIYAKEGQTKWPDYVFAPNYPLPSLSDVAKHIEKYRHLPGLPSAEEVRKKGYSLLDVQTALVEKVEELTLYVLSLQRQVDSLKTALALCQKPVK
ncbi:MAG: hypothetical protein N2170_01680 [Bacteroidia bacterium]|nr:hypothetical protein [Bacteroidia bacterium]